jgi:hypothetical protein
MERAEPGGLFAGGQRIPLHGVTIKAKVRGVASEVTVAQRYQNREKVPVEAVYSFPLQESAAVCAFEVQIDGRRIVGKVQEREKAFDQYDQALATQDNAHVSSLRRRPCSGNPPGADASPGRSGRLCAASWRRFTYGHGRFPGRDDGDFAFGRVCGAERHMVSQNGHFCARR